MDLLKFFTAGNVDDGKSTLIGRLLLDSGSISTDIIDTLTKQSKSTGGDTGIDLALLTDGLRAEREQGITIDVAYKYFSTEKRKFIIADTPGHTQYTRNMFTGASNADLAVILIDARNGITEQTRRHSLICSVLRTPRILICVNKMDLAGYSEDRYTDIVLDYRELAKQLEIDTVDFIPLSALNGDNVTSPSVNLSWYKGPTLLSYLEEVETENRNEEQPARFRVQYVIRPQSEELHDYRGYAGTVLSGKYSKGQKVKVLSGNSETRIAKIEIHGKEAEHAFEGDPVVLHLEHDIDTGRGSTIVPTDDLPQGGKELAARICWMDDREFTPGQKLLLQQGSFRTRVSLKEIIFKTDIQELKQVASDGGLKLNEIADVHLRTAEELFYDEFRKNRNTGSFILISEHSNNTVAAGVLMQ